MAKGGCSNCTKTSIGGSRKTVLSHPFRSSSRAAPSGRGTGKAAVKITFGKKR
jgi:hypothetical protein